MAIHQYRDDVYRQVYNILRRASRAVTAIVKNDSATFVTRGALYAPACPQILRKPQLLSATEQAYILRRPNGMQPTRLVGGQVKDSRVADWRGPEERTTQGPDAAQGGTFPQQGDRAVTVSGTQRKDSSYE